MDEDKSTAEAIPRNITIRLPDGTDWTTGEDLDFRELLDNLVEFIKSPELHSSILPAMSEHFIRRHKEIMERLSLEKQKVAQAGKYELQFLIGRLVMGGALIFSVTWLTLTGHLATETTIVTLMATLGFIMWGKGQN